MSEPVEPTHSDVNEPEEESIQEAKPTKQLSRSVIYTQPDQEYHEIINNFIDDFNTFKDDTYQYLEDTDWKNGKIARILYYTEQLQKLLNEF